MEAVAAGYRKGLVTSGWPVLLLSFTLINKCRKRSFRTPFQAAFSLEERCLDGGP